MENRLYVGNLSFDASEEDLKELFSQAGEITEVAIIRNKFSGRSKGFAFITMGDVDSANRAVERFNGFDHMGRALQVNVAKPREERADDGGARRPFRRNFRSNGHGGGHGHGGHGHGGGHSHGGGRRSFNRHED